jgi:methyl-CpG-binding domain protein 4
MDGLTEYERQRLAHIQRNLEYMASCGVLEAASTFNAAAKAVVVTKPAKRRRAEDRPKAEPTRRSGRLANMPAERDGADIDALESDEEEEKEQKRGGGNVFVDKEAQARALLEHTREWLAASRAALAKLGDGLTVPATDDEWCVTTHASSVLGYLSTVC